MTRFIIYSNPPFLTRDITAFYHTDFYGTDHPDNPNYLYKIKNDPHHNWTNIQVRNAVDELSRILREDLPEIRRQVGARCLTACVVPRAKALNRYRENQLLFKTTVEDVVHRLDGFDNGADYIIRHSNTRTTHLRRPIEGYVNDGDLPYPGIMLETCNISRNIRERTTCFSLLQGKH